jgi:hypothetical protein
LQKTLIEKHGHFWANRLKDVTWQGSGMVLSPMGIALHQGPLRGKMRWEEITEIRWHYEARSIALIVPGSRIVIEDIYNQPIRVIYDLLFAFWQPPT